MNPMANIKIAVIEDDHSIQQMYRLKLEMSGYDVKTAGDGVAGLELVEAFEPQLILLDIKMPHLSGDEMLRKLRETAKGAAIKVIILTNISRAEAPKSLQLLNSERYIIKAHYTPQQVVDLVKEVMLSRTQQA